MIFAHDITTPANTSKASPLRTEIELTKGIIHKIELEFPTGNQFMHRVQLLREGSFMFPTNPQGFFTSEGNIISYREYVELKDHPFNVWVHSWNEDETYNHTVIIRIGILRKRIIAPWQMTWREKLADDEVS